MKYLELFTYKTIAKLFAWAHLFCSDTFPVIFAQRKDQMQEMLSWLTDSSFSMVSAHLKVVQSSSTRLTLFRWTVNERYMVETFTRSYAGFSQVTVWRISPDCVTHNSPGTWLQTDVMYPLSSDVLLHFPEKQKIVSLSNASAAGACRLPLPVAAMPRSIQFTRFLCCSHIGVLFLDC